MPIWRVGGQRRLGRAPGIGEEFQRPLRRHRGIELAQRARRRIARIGEQRLCPPPPAVRSRRRNRRGSYRLRRARRARRGAAPASRCGMSAMVRTLAVTSSPTRPSPRVAALDQHAFLIAQRTGQAVDLRLGGEGDVRLRGEAEKAFHARDEFLQFVVGENIAEREHRHGMGDFGEFLGRRRADLAAQRIRAGEFGKARLQRLVAAAQGIVFGVGHDRRVVLVIGAVMRGDFLAELLLCSLARARKFVALAHASELADIFSPVLSARFQSALRRRRALPR